MRRYYFYASYASSHMPNWYTMTTETLREAIAKTRNEDGLFTHPFPPSFIFVGKYTETKDKDEAEANFRNKINLQNGKEPACMLRARREYFEQSFAVI